MQALGRALYEHSESLGDSAWSFLPRRGPGAFSSLIQGVEEENNPGLKILAEFIAAVLSYADGTTDELSNALEERDIERLKYKMLQALVRGEDTSTVEEDEEVLPNRSHQRKRAKFGRAQTYLN